MIPVRAIPTEDAILISAQRPGHRFFDLVDCESEVVIGQLSVEDSDRQEIILVIRCESKTTVVFFDKELVVKGSVAFLESCGFEFVKADK